jgi:hypothetical protein
MNLPLRNKKLSPSLLRSHSSTHSFNDFSLNTQYNLLNNTPFYCFFWNKQKEIFLNINCCHTHKSVRGKWKRVRERWKAKRSHKIFSFIKYRKEPLKYRNKRLSLSINNILLLYKMTKSLFYLNLINSQSSSFLFMLKWEATAAELFLILCVHETMNRPLVTQFIRSKCHIYLFTRSLYLLNGRE